MKEREHPPTPLHYIIIGYGNFGHKWHQTLGPHCLATVSRNPQRGAYFTNVSQIPESTLNQCEAVIVTLPEPVKLPAVEFWLAQGKNVLVEKPLILSPKQASHLSKIARENQVIWHTGYNHRFEPHVVKIKELIDGGFLGELYHARITYGFGNARQMVGTWRDERLGVLADVGSHLIDLTHFLFGYQGKDFRAIKLRRLEFQNGLDHCLFATRDYRIILQTSAVTWKNTFVIEAYGEKGSLHMNGLCKWGGSKLILRQRVLPAGVPKEEGFEIVNPPPYTDPTFVKEMKYFEEQIRNGQTSCENDLLISQAIQTITH